MKIAPTFITMAAVIALPLAAAAVPGRIAEFARFTGRRRIDWRFVMGRIA